MASRPLRFPIEVVETPVVRVSSAARAADPEGTVLMRAFDRKSILIFAFVLLCSLAGQTPAVAQSWSNGYAYRRAITIDHTKVPNTDQANFPVLVSGTYSYLATISNGGNVTNENGYDIIFTSDSAQTSILKL